MNFTPAEGFSLNFFILFCLGILATVCYAVWITSRETSIKFYNLLLFYLMVFSVVVQSGLALNYIIPILPLLILSVLAGSVLFAFSSYGKNIADKIPLMWLIGFQAFRLPLELILHDWAGSGTIPPTMTWSGQNWDIFSGVLAIACAALVGKFRQAAWVFQAVGGLLLLNVLRVVLMSSPLPFGWRLVNPVQLMFYLPYAWIAPLMVGSAITGHLILFRVLLQGQSRAASQVQVKA